MSGEILTGTTANSQWQVGQKGVLYVSSTTVLQIGQFINVLSEIDCEVFVTEQIADVGRHIDGRIHKTSHKQSIYYPIFL